MTGSNNGRYLDDALIVDLAALGDWRRVDLQHVEPARLVGALWVCNGYTRMHAYTHMLFSL